MSLKKIPIYPLTTRVLKISQFTHLPHESYKYPNLPTNHTSLKKYPNLPTNHMSLKKYYNLPTNHMS